MTESLRDNCAGGCRGCCVMGPTMNAGPVGVLGSGVSKVGIILCSVLLATLCTTADAQSWRTVRPEGAGFEATFPAEPETRTRTERDDYGAWTNRTFRVLSRPEAYQVTLKDYSHYDVSGVPIDQVLALMCRTAVGLRRAEVVPIRFGVPARQCRGQNGAEARVYWRAPILYTAAFLCGGGSCSAEHRARFFEGFRLR